MKFLSAIFTSRLALAQFVALAFAVLAMFGVVPTGGFSQENIVIVAMFGFAAVSAIGRLGVAGPILELDTNLGAKPWWQSKTIWAQAVSAGAALAASLGLLPASFNEAAVLEGILAATAIATIVLRPTARAIA